MINKKIILLSLISIICSNQITLALVPMAHKPTKRKKQYQAPTTNDSSYSYSSSSASSYTPASSNYSYDDTDNNDYRTSTSTTSRYTPATSTSSTEDYISYKARASIEMKPLYVTIESPKKQYFSSSDENNTVSLMFDTLFSKEDLKDGLSLTVIIIPPSTELTSSSTLQTKKYHIIAMIKTEDNLVIKQQSIDHTFPTIPTNLSIDYGNTTILTKQFYSGNSQANFIKNSPFIEEFTIQQSKNAVSAY